jgi:hypothetical protein
MNTNNELQIQTTVLSKVLDRSIIVIKRKYYNRLSNQIMSTQINIFNI